MILSGIVSNNVFSYPNQTVQNRMQQFGQEFQQLGQDLQSGNLSAAQQDFATLQQLSPQSSSTSSSTQSNNPITQAFNQLSQDLKAGNLSAAQQDYTKIQQDFQNQGAEGHHAHHHHHGGGGESSQVSQLFSELGQELQSSNVSAAQQTYNTLLQDFQFSPSTSAQPSSQPSTSGISVSA
jgi:outer membrane protein assembly factor BamD (BamD/ComL family)